MNPVLADTLSFAAKDFVIFITIVVTTAVMIALLSRRRRERAGHLQVTKLNQRYKDLVDSLRWKTLDKKDRKAFAARRKKERQKTSSTPHPKNVYVLDFHGDLLATGVAHLREEVTAVAAVAGPDDEVVVRLESPGGAVSHYGLAAAQLARLRAHSVKLTVCVDRVAASGGYMMACVADRIVAAPFAVVGSIGVVAQVPNFHRLLKKHDVDFEEMTAGEYKRTVSILGEITEKGRKKFGEQLEDTHALFREFIRTQRPALDVDKVATGEHWLATRAVGLGLVDEIATSDEYLQARASEANLFEVHYTPAEAWRKRIATITGDALERALVQVWSKLRAVAFE
jgi:serine protease SohB